MNVVRNKDFWLAVDAYGQDIPNVSSLLTRMTTGGVGFSAETVSHSAPELAVRSLAEKDASTQQFLNSQQAVEKSSRTLFDEVISFDSLVTSAHQVLSGASGLSTTSNDTSLKKDVLGSTSGETEAVTLRLA